MLGISGIPALIQLALMACFPESPKWLIKKDRLEEAVEIFSKVFNTKNPVGEREMKREVEIIKEELILEGAKVSQILKYKELFSVYTKLVFIGVMLQLWQQLTGINTVMYYSPTILDIAGFGNKDDHMFVNSFFKNQ